MKFNGLKFQVMRYGRNKEKNKDTVYFTPDMESTIEQFESLRDLGVILNNEATFVDHIEHV